MGMHIQMKRRFLFSSLAIFGLVACVSENPKSPSRMDQVSAASTTPQKSVPASTRDVSKPTEIPQELVPVSATLTPEYFAVSQRILPIAKTHCRAAGLPNCNFTFLTDIAPGRPSNAWQRREGTRPVIIVSLPFFDEVQNIDQLAFVLGHEVAHLIRNHQPRGRVDIESAALTQALDAYQSGGNVEEAHERGARAGRLQYSQAYELEADALGARIAFDAGFDPTQGVAYFYQRRSQSGHVHSTHPPNAARLAAVRRVIAGF